MAEYEEQGVFVDIDRVEADKMYMIIEGHVPVDEYHAFQEFDDRINIGYLIQDGVEECLTGKEVLSENGIEGKLVFTDNGQFFVKDAKGDVTEIASPFYHAETSETIDGKAMYATTVLKEFIDVQGCTEEEESFRNTVYAGYRDDPFHNSHEEEHRDEDNN
jgi:hypothetical protein